MRLQQNALVARVSNDNRRNDFGVGTAASEASWATVVALAVILAVLSVARVSSLSAFRFDVLGVTADVSPLQVVLMAVLIVTVVSAPAARQGRAIRAILAGAYLVFVYDLIVVIIDERTPTDAVLRGVFAVALNASFVVFLHRNLARRIEARTVARIVVGFGVIVAVSGLVEFLLVHLGAGLIPGWRNLITGAQQDQLLTVGGVSLSDSNVIRVGGLVGAPENLGLTLALSLPFLDVANWTRRGRAAYLLLLAAVAVASGTRALIVAVGLFVVLSLLFGSAARARVRATLMLAVILVTGWMLSVLGNPLLVDRLNASGLSTEYEWRLARAQALAEGLARGPWSWLTGHGLGWGVEQQSNVQAVTSGLLGGDFAVAYLLGGVVGLTTLALFWIGIFRGLRGRLSGGSPVTPMYFVALVASLSLVTPMLTLFILGTGIPTMLLFGFPLVWEAAVQRARHESGEGVAPKTIRNPSLGSGY